VPPRHQAVLEPGFLSQFANDHHSGDGQRQDNDQANQGRRPALVGAVIAISGLFDSGHGLGADDALALGAARALAKPFKRAELLRATAEVLSSPEP